MHDSLFPTKKWRIFLIARPQQRPRRQIDLVNENIHFREVMLIDNGSKKVMSTRDAQRIADQRNLDLVIVQAKAQPPVARIMDWGKVKFEQQKKIRENKKKQVIVQTKEVRLSPVIGEGDFETRKKAATKFLVAGNKVKLNLRFRGRMMAHQDVGRQVLMNMAKQLADLANIDQMPQLLGRQMSLLLSPKPEVIKKAQSEKKNKLKENTNAKDED
ncbi:translation initiation factor 3 [Oenococcus oeni]|uniref:translation initiation factor IF-3 n=1 Tax=Oenococcus oeni TaxID=1247 RepID=UPI000BDF44FA|nr:translation initiation factor IF-3 [Oenococcus oeni]PDH88652.1 translation initiation factor 3 [Oenococcus oeni]PDH89280.1 translation initiation factor 3 [Oenococcus oeni]PDH90181.1 translation initiation factor 3 [Oenococcus oeni]PDH90217.1 translation initiation factor 3 [Oenococcus oeni]PDH93044.1 translation initiation factor 3 [Oenococcus oeni]